MSRAPIPIRLDEEGPFGCCHACTGRGSEDCDECVDADLYELDEDVAHAEAEQHALEAA